MIKGVICDLDGFLVKTWGTEPLEGVLTTLAALDERGMLLAVATNQAGPLWRVTTGQEKFPTADEVAGRLFECAKQLDLVTARWYIAIDDARALESVPADEWEEVLGDLRGEFEHALLMSGLYGVVSEQPDWRKPGPGMLLSACKAWGIEPGEAIYGGDMDSDREAAHAAGIRFVETLPEVLPLLDA